ncbi:MAG TPA: universal stress protein [Burkholderiales bacterium]|jgi:nucleotide-binding universal stress UspA family protein|nr:universal stress protein [Burkholderiales bacterium]
MMKILLPVDGSENSLRAVRHVMAMKEQHRDPIEVHLLNVQLPVASGAVKMFISQQQLNDFYRDEGVAALKDARALLDQAGVPYQHHIGVGDLAGTIVSYAKEKQCRQIVIGTRGRGSFAGALLGSVTNKVIHLADMPVLLIK